MSVSSVSSKDAKYDLEKSPAKVVVTSSEITEAHDGVNRSNGAFAKVCPSPLSLAPRSSRRIARLRRFPGRVLTLFLFSSGRSSSTSTRSVSKSGTCRVSVDEELD